MPTQTVPNLAQDPTRRQFLAAGIAVGGAMAILGDFPEAVAQPDIRPTVTKSTTVSLNINGQNCPVDLEPRTTLLDALRDHLAITGTKKGCNHGQCGACTVLINGRRINSCLTLAVMHQDDQIITVEGLANGQTLHPVQQAFIDNDAFQCGYCTPGQLCSAVGLIKEGHAKTDDEIREAMAGNICRCGAYPNIVAAVRQAMNPS